MNASHHMLRRQAGLTLVELLVAVGLGLLLLLGVAALFTQNKQSYRANEDLARLQEDARFALDELSRDISMAGFFAESVDPSSVFVGYSAAVQPIYDGALGATVDCGPAGFGRNWFYALDTGLVENSMAIGDNVASGAAANTLFSCIDAGQFEVGTDLIGIKRTAGAASGVSDLANGINNPAPAGRVYLRENGTRSVLFPGAPADPDRAVPDPYRDWEYAPRIYYVRNFGLAAGDGIPTLCRVRLVNDGTGGNPPVHTEECLAQGVEDLQLEFGIDTNEDGAANAYVTAPTPNQLTQTVSVRIYLLMRSINVDVGYTDDRTYTVSNSGAVTPADRFHRRVFSSTVMVRNMTNLRQLAF